MIYQKNKDYLFGKNVLYLTTRPLKKRLKNKDLFSFIKIDDQFIKDYLSTSFELRGYPLTIKEIKKKSSNEIQQILTTVFDMLNFLITNDMFVPSKEGFNWTDIKYLRKIVGSTEKKRKKGEGRWLN